MGLPADLPVVDHHCHLSPRGEGVEAARRFARAGGTHLFLTTQQYGPAVPRSVEEYERQFDTTERLGRRIEEETGVRVFPVVAPYPVDLVHLEPALGLARARELQEQALDAAGRWVRERRAVALGEVGRPHFHVEPAVAAAADEVFAHALSVAHDVGAPAVVHCEDLDAEGYRRMADLGGRVGLRPERIVKHYARTFLGAEQRCGIVPSFLARRPLVAEALGSPGPWFLETDFLDDPARPGAVLDLETVPRRAKSLIALDPSWAERLREPFEKSVTRVYGFTPRAGAGKNER